MLKTQRAEIRARVDAGSVQGKQDILALLAELDRLRAALQNAVDLCSTCDGTGSIPIEGHDMDTCPTCGPWRQVLRDE